jgi:hypothetical protein
VEDEKINTLLSLAMETQLFFLTSAMHVFSKLSSKQPQLS